MNYQLLGSLHKEMISIEGNGFTRINLRQDRLLDIPVFVPPFSEQQQIVSFLDTKTSLIDSLIEKTQRKIELLKEKRTSLINEVVTKGLNPNVEMKDSGGFSSDNQHTSIKGLVEHNALNDILVSLPNISFGCIILNVTISVELLIFTNSMSISLYTLPLNLRPCAVTSF